jgi:hypothetical protein
MKKSRLHELFDYREDGHLLRKIKPNSKANKLSPIGEPAGTITDRGYRVLQVEGKLHKVHNLIYIFHHGKIPKNQIIDHIDGDPDNNRIENLRSVTISQNMCNRKMPKHNKSGVKGVCWNKYRNKWTVGITHNKKKIYGGLYDNLDEATAKIKELRAFYHKEYGRE